MLSNSHQVIDKNGASLVMAGIEDPMAARFGPHTPSLELALQGAPDTARILLAHRPNGAVNAKNVDLQLSGHTHGGLIRGFEPVIASYNEGFVRGLYNLGPLHLYVSPGTGLWNGFSCRIGVPSEITHFILRAG